MNQYLRRASRRLPVRLAAATGLIVSCLVLAASPAAADNCATPQDCFAVLSALATAGSTVAVVAPLAVALRTPIAMAGAGSGAAPATGAAAASAPAVAQAARAAAALGMPPPGPARQAPPRPGPQPARTASPSSPTGRGLWTLKPFARGDVGERLAAGGRVEISLTRTFKTIDRVIPGLGTFAERITSTKTMDLTAKTYATQSSAVYNRLNSYVDRLQGFTTYTLTGTVVTAGPKTERVLEVILEGTGTPAQMAEIAAAEARAAAKGIRFDVRFMP